MGIFVAKTPCAHPLADDFGQAAHRYWNDAERLFSQNSLPTADHLYGLSAECALKAIINKPNCSKSLWGHMPQLWNEFLQHPDNPFAQSAPPNPFSIWCIDHRYAADLHFTQNRVQDHKKGASDAMKLLQQLRTNGGTSP